jgi:Fe2+ or Zn2+ uptake regulation protein
MAGPAAEERLAEELSERGLRATRQRIGVLKALRRSRSHPTARQLHESLTSQQPVPASRRSTKLGSSSRR